MATEGVKQRGNFELEKLASIPSFYLPKLNHAKDKLSFYWDKTGRLELFVMDLQSKELTQISDGQLPRTLRAGYIWDRDNETIYFTKDTNGDEQHNIYSININTKEVNQLTETPDAQEYLADTSPDGKWLILDTNRGNTQMNLYRMNLESGEVEQITAHENPAMGGIYSEDGQYIAYSSNEEGDLKNQDIYLARPDGSEVKLVVQTAVGSADNFADWAKDGSSFIFTTDVHGNQQVAAYDLETEEIRYYGDGSISEQAGKITEDGKIIAIVNEDASIKPVIYDLATGDRHELDFPRGLVIGTELLDANHLILTINRPSSPSTLVLFDLNDETYDILLETDTGDIDQSLFVDNEYIHYESDDGTSIPAIIYRPRDFNPDHSYPAILVPHGGPTAQYFNNFSITAQFLTDLGYVVMQPNVRGSTGYGVEFRDACLNDWGGKDHQDWIAGRQWLIDNAAVDPDRVIVYGGSYGGYATLWCMGNSPNLWAAGVAWVPVTDLPAMYGESMEHFKYYLRQQMGDPEKNKELWIERSPSTHIQNMKSPLLLVHGTNDPRCPVSQSHIVVNKLKEHGFEEGKNKDFEYVEYDNEGHGAASDIQGRIRSLKLLSDFLYRRIEQN